MDKKVVAIHQPNFLPWLGYFYKMSQCDIFVFLDDVEYTKNSFINRNRIKTPSGEAWITLPVSYSGKSTQKIHECQVVGKDKAVKKILGQILHNYKQAKFFSHYYEPLSDILHNSGENLAELNIRLTKWIAGIFHLEVKFARSSELDIHASDATDRLIKICLKLDGTNYLSGSGGMNYQDEERFMKEGINLELSSFKHPKYDQLWGEFTASLSIVDYLLNQGPKAFH
jgi:hypothetical protein